MTNWARHPGQWVKKAGTVKRLHTRCGDGALREHLADGWVACDEHGNVPTTTSIVPSQPPPPPPPTPTPPAPEKPKKGTRGKP